MRRKMDIVIDKKKEMRESLDVSRVVLFEIMS